MTPSIFASSPRIVAQLGDPLLQVAELVLDLLAREAGEAREPHVEDRLRLDLGEPEPLHQAGARRLGAVASRGSAR